MILYAYEIERSASSCRDYIENLTATGRYHFSSADARKALGISSAAVKLALVRLARQKLIASPARGFYVVVPPEYRSPELPSSRPVHSRAHGTQICDYAGLLSAAQYFGAAHHRPQVFQVMLERARRPIHCGQVRVVCRSQKSEGRADADLQDAARRDQRFRLRRRPPSISSAIIITLGDLIR